MSIATHRSNLTYNKFSWWTTNTFYRLCYFKQIPARWKQISKPFEQQMCFQYLEGKKQQQGVWYKKKIMV